MKTPDFSSNCHQTTVFRATYFVMCSQKGWLGRRWASDGAVADHNVCMNMHVHPSSSLLLPSAMMHPGAWGLVTGRTMQRGRDPLCRAGAQRVGGGVPLPWTRKTLVRSCCWQCRLLGCGSIMRGNPMSFFSLVLRGRRSTSENKKIGNFTNTIRKIIIFWTTPAPDQTPEGICSLGSG